MSAVIGIPQALAFYYYHTLWRTFFSELGCRVIMSGMTDRSIIESGIACVPNEACLPLKCYAGHVAYLCTRRGNERIDLIFVPRLVCIQVKPTVKLCCPKFIGLPDMVRALIPDAPLLSIDIDLRVQPQREAFLALAAHLGCSARSARHAYQAAANASRPCASDEPDPERTTPDIITIALLGHRYLLEDPYLCLDVKKRLVSDGCRVIEHTAFSPIGTCHLDDRVRPTSWLFEDDILSGAHRFLHQNTVDGIVYLLSFGCGAGSITSEIIEHELRSGSHVPILRIIIDEHTAEAGFQTRLESFIDMIRIRKKPGGGA
jgi:predicted nucleotide-binding protein (sugar kinase/HSP70/actin superfamily)